MYAERLMFIVNKYVIHFVCFSDHIISNHLHYTRGDSSGKFYNISLLYDCIYDTVSDYDTIGHNMCTTQDRLVLKKTFIEPIGFEKAWQCRRGRRISRECMICTVVIDTCKNFVITAYPSA
jgi:hypothetical protein